MKRTEWAEREERSNVPLLRAMTWISLRCGRPFGRVVLRLVAAYFVVFSPAARRARRVSEPRDFASFRPSLSRSNPWCR